MMIEFQLRHSYRLWQFESGKLDTVLPQGTATVSEQHHGEKERRCLVLLADINHRRNHAFTALVSDWTKSSPEIPHRSLYDPHIYLAGVGLSIKLDMRILTHKLF